MKQFQTLDGTKVKVHSVDNNGIFGTPETSTSTHRWELDGAGAGLSHKIPFSQGMAQIIRREFLPGPEQDVVNEPPHYRSHPSGVECLTVAREMNFNRGNALKYLWRAGLKDPAKEIEDLKKARFYLDDEIKRLENKTP